MSRSAAASRLCRPGLDADIPPASYSEVAAAIEYLQRMGEPTATHDIEVLDYEQFRARRADPAVAVIDVLPPATYRHSHIAGAVNLPLADVRDRAAELLPDRDQEIILYCASFT